jgi:ribosomal protein S18 acetylase RimI-like enzyme
MRRLAASPRRNLFLMELVAAVGSPPAPHEVPAHVVGLFQGSELEALAALRPTLVLDSEMTPEQLERIRPSFESIESGLVKSADQLVSRLWEWLSGCGRRALVDRIETSYALDPENLCDVDDPADATVRPAQDRDLEALVTAARASLREEQRPDPFDGDPSGFRRWVRGRLHRARVVQVGGQVVFVGYADVRRSEGWLIQGVYSWPAARRRGYARAGMNALAREAFASGADHVQLAVVEGNTPAVNLYEGLGFQPFDTLRTILFIP